MHITLAHELHKEWTHDLGTSELWAMSQDFFGVAFAEQLFQFVDVSLLSLSDAT